MFKSGMIEIALALLTATPVLAQMSQLPAGTSNAGGPKSPANDETPAVPGSSAGSTSSNTGYGNANGYGPANTENRACSSAGTPQSGICNTQGKTQIQPQATQPPRKLSPRAG